MINNLQKQFKVSTKTDYPFKPEKEEPKTAHIYLNSQDKMSGTNASASFKVNLPCPFKTNKLNLSLTNFIVNYPTNTAGGIVAVNMVGIENPYSYGSGCKTTHRTLGVFALDEGREVEYPPRAMTANTTTISGQSYGNGTYVASMTSTDLGSASMAFDKGYNGLAVRTAFNGGYNTNTGLYQASTYSTTMSGVLYGGEHLTLQMPSPIVLTKYDYTSHGEAGVRCGNSWVVGGSTNGSNWTLLDSRSNVSWTSNNQTQTFTVSNNSNAFNYYRMLTTRVGNNSATQFKDDWGIAEWKICGYTAQPQRIGQCNLNSEIITTDNTLFNRPITLSLSSPSGLDLSTINNWSCQLKVSEIK